MLAPKRRGDVYFGLAFQGPVKAFAKNCEWAERINRWALNSLSPQMTVTSENASWLKYLGCKRQTEPPLCAETYSSNEPREAPIGFFAVVGLYATRSP